MEGKNGLIEQREKKGNRLNRSVLGKEEREREHFSLRGRMGGNIGNLNFVK